MICSERVKNVEEGLFHLLPLPELLEKLRSVMSVALVLVELSDWLQQVGEGVKPPLPVILDSKAQPQVERRKLRLQNINHLAFIVW